MKTGCSMNIAIVGCGLIGEKRLKALREHRLLYAIDPQIPRAERLCTLKGEGRALANWEDIVNDPALNLVIIAVTNNLLASMAAAFLRENKHILVEKPAGKNPADIRQALDAQAKSSAFAKVGFNHRYHPAMLKAKELVQSGVLGELMFIRGRYGHGGRLGYEKEWRFDREISGGGELLDQGVHLIDLSRWLIGEEFTQISGHADRFFWEMELDDNGFMDLRTDSGKTAWLHVSCTEWKNLFSLEIYGKYGKLHIDGLGGSYGLERLAYYKMLPEMGPPETTIWEYPFPDKSWEAECAYFVNCIEKGTPPEGNLFDAAQALHIVHTIYGGEQI